ncbi:hypothetical protein C8J57DRAFT_1210504 [Mycena rebaudengoi]|nr:hypothetical protein C8J57DRAFT_1210504 [Mycena rebaudengoi]
MAAAHMIFPIRQLLANFPRPKPGNPLLGQFFEGSALKPFHPLANQIDFDPRENIFHHILSLWNPPAEMLPTDDDVDDELPLLLQDWLDSDPALLSQIINLNTRTLRRYELHCKAKLGLAKHTAESCAPLAEVSVHRLCAFFWNFSTLIVTTAAAGSPSLPSGLELACPQQGSSVLHEKSSVFGRRAFGERMRDLSIMAAL